MRITQFSDIGLRVLIYLSRTGGEAAPTTVAEIASQFSIPTNHLVKVVGELVRLGWVQAIRGRNGGIRLCVHVSTLRVGAMLRELEGDTELVDCAARQCRLRHDCLLRDALKAGLQAFYDTLDQYTLADLAAGHTGEQIVRMHHEFLNRLPQAECIKA